MRFRKNKMAGALEEYVNNVRTMSFEGNFRGLAEFLSRSSEILTKNVEHLDNVLQTLDLEHHSLGILAILCVKLTVPNVPEFEPLFSQVQEFVTGCNSEQVCFSPELFADLCHLVTQNLMERKIPLRGINILSKAIQKLQSSETQLTSIHADLCELCLMARCLKPALKFLDADINDIHQEGGHFETRHLLSYYYYGGMIYSALKKYERALYCFEVAITTPAVAVSYIVIESYKKYILVSLVLHGKVLNLPKYTSQVIGRFIKPLSHPYHNLANAYATNKVDDVKAVITQHQDKYDRDKNTGLVKQVLASLYRRNVRRLTKTFLTLSLTDMATLVQLSGPKEAEDFIVNMKCKAEARELITEPLQIADGEIFATINQKDGMVIFHDDPETYDATSTLDTIEKELFTIIISRTLQMALCKELAEKVRLMDEDITVNVQYVKKTSGSMEDLVGPTVGSKLHTHSL